MSPIPEIILRNVMRNSSMGTFGSVVDESSGEPPPPELPPSPSRDFDEAAAALALEAKEEEVDLLDYGDIASSNFTLLNNTVCVNATASYNSHDGVTNLADIPAKEIIIVVLMLSLWIYSIVLTRKAWNKVLGK